MERLNTLLHTAGVSLRSGDSGPCLVTVVNSSRIQADITRDTRVLTGDQTGLTCCRKDCCRFGEPGSDSGGPDPLQGGAGQIHLPGDVDDGPGAWLPAASRDVC